MGQEWLEHRLKETVRALTNVVEHAVEVEFAVADETANGTCSLRTSSSTPELLLPEPQPPASPCSLFAREVDFQSLWFEKGRSSGYTQVPDYVLQFWMLYLNQIKPKTFDLLYRITFNVEVTRMRERAEGELTLFDPQAEGRRLADIVSSKLGQMQPSIMNLLVIIADDPRLCELEIGQVMNQLKQRAEQKEVSLFQRYGFRDTADFFKYYQRLSGVLLRSTGQPETGTCPRLWLNNQTKHPLPAPIGTILQRQSASF